MTNTHSSKHSKGSKGPTLAGLQAVGRPWLSQQVNKSGKETVYRLKKNANATKSSGRAKNRIKPKNHKRKK